MSATTGGELFQYSLYAGLHLQDILYGKFGNLHMHLGSPGHLLAGVELVLYFKTMHSLLHHHGERTKSDIFFAIFSSAMLVISTIWVITQAINGRKMWLQNMSFPSDADKVWAENISAWYMDMATLSVTILQLMTDALMVRQCTRRANTCAHSRS